MERLSALEADTLSMSVSEEINFQRGCIARILRLTTASKVTKRFKAVKVAKKRISSADLCWLISEELYELKGVRSRPSLAVVPDRKNGWRVIIPNTSRRYWTSADDQRLAEIQRRLRSVYQLRS